MLLLSRILGANLALGKPAEQSSFWEEYPGPASAAVDGIYFSETQIYCTHTERESEPWWGVDLEAIYTIATVKVLNRDMGRF